MSKIAATWGAKGKHFILDHESRVILTQPGGKGGGVRESNYQRVLRAASLGEVWNLAAFVGGVVNRRWGKISFTWGSIGIDTQRTKIVEWVFVFFWGVCCGGYQGGGMTYVDRETF